MALGFRNTIGEVNVGDTAEMPAYLRINDQPVTEDQILSVSYMVQDPTGTSSTVPGVIQDDGSGFLRWTDTVVPGLYMVQAQFTLVSGEVRSVMTNFTVIDPFNPEPPDPIQLITQQVWLRLEDMFDSIEGGPFLRDETMAQFDQIKISDFIPEALLDINVQMPPTQFTIDQFTLPTTIDGAVSPNPNMPILIKGTLCVVIRHLMRSYVEQPMMAGGQIVWEDRTRYQTAWATQYAVEEKDFLDMTRLWKRTLLNLGHSSLLTFNKAGRLFPYAGARSRNAGRGYY